MAHLCPGRSRESAPDGYPEFPDDPHDWRFLEVMHWQKLGKYGEELALIGKGDYF